MKLRVIAILMVLLSGIVLAQEINLTDQPVNTYNLEDFSKEPKQAAWLKTDDFVFFNLLGKKNAVRIDLVYKDNAMVVLYPDIETAPKGAYAPIKNGYFLNVDLNKDDVTDMTIRLEEIQGEEGLFVFESLVQDESKPEVQGLVVSGETNKDNTLLLIAVGIGALLGLLLVLGLKKQSPKVEKPVQKTE